VKERLFDLIHKFDKPDKIPAEEELRQETTKHLLDVIFSLTKNRGWNEE
jgi:hypothetical protein